VFVVAAAVVSTRSDFAAARAREAERRRREADLASELARLLLGAPDPRAALSGAAKRIADALEGHRPVFAPHPHGTLREAAFQAAFHVEAG
jgi:hypothetical protein